MQVGRERAIERERNIKPVWNKWSRRELCGGVGQQWSLQNMKIIVSSMANEKVECMKPYVNLSFKNAE